MNIHCDPGVVLKRSGFGEAGGRLDTAKINGFRPDSKLSEFLDLCAEEHMARLSYLAVLKVSDRRRNKPKSIHKFSESLCAGLWVPCWLFWVWLGPVLGLNPARNLRFPAGSFNIFRGT